MPPNERLSDGPGLPRSNTPEALKPQASDTSYDAVRKTVIRFFLERGDTLMAMLILLIGLGAGVYAIYSWRDLFAVGFLGLETFFLVVIAGMFVGNGQKSMDQGQVRRAVVAAWVAAFFGLLAVGNGISATGSIISNTLNQFWWAFTVVFSTYIAGRTIESVVPRRTKT